MRFYLMNHTFFMCQSIDLKQTMYCAADDLDTAGIAGVISASDILLSAVFIVKIFSKRNTYTKADPFHL